MHDAGGSPAWELAFAVAAGLAHVKALTQAGLAVGDAFSRVVIALAVDNKPLIGVAKLRAARLMWAQDHLGQRRRRRPPVIEARSSYRMLTIADPWSNLVRLTQAGFAGAVGGADAIVLSPARPGQRAAGDPLSRPLHAQHRVDPDGGGASRGAVDDPTGGAWAFEALTADLARDAWAIFNRIEREGGAAQALRSGMVAEAAAASVAELAASIGGKTTRIVGVTDFRADAPPEAFDPVTAAPLAPIRVEALAR